VASSPHRYGLKHKLELKRAKHTTVLKRTKPSSAVRKLSNGRANESDKEGGSVKDKYRLEVKSFKDDHQPSTSSCTNNSKSFPNGPVPTHEYSSNCSPKEEDSVLELESEGESNQEEVTSDSGDVESLEEGEECESEDHDDALNSVCSSVAGQRSRIPLPIANSTLTSSKHVSLFMKSDFLGQQLFHL